MANETKKYHFEGKRKDAKGKGVYVVLELKTGKILEWDEATYKKNQSQVES